jgi:demethylmenaquinone methyltransferase/2-methoxy-6-polyprenyl-1,4-benzoquinol methylase
MLRVNEGESTLEIGFGTGDNLIRLAERVGKSGSVHGIDISIGMYDRAIGKIRHRSLEERITLTLGDATSLPYYDSTFDIIFMSFVLELFATEEIPIVLAECLRVMKPSGRLGIVSLKKKDKFMVRLYEWFHNMMPSVVDCRPIYPSGSIEKAGFSIDKSVEKTMFGIPVEIVVGVKPE